jgi:hypothetical protein
MKKRKPNRYASELCEVVKKRMKRYSNTYAKPQECFLQLLIEQDYKCGICEDNLNYFKGFNLDHDHITGEPRGYLCHVCNTAEGFFPPEEIMDFASKVYNYRTNTPFKKITV